MRSCFKHILFFASFLMLLAPSTKGQVDTIAHWGFEEGSGLVTRESISKSDFSIKTREKNSERVPGVLGHALRTDGYSTWIEGNLPITIPVNLLSVSGWVALESYPGTEADIWSKMDTKEFNGLRVGLSKYGRIEYQFSINNVSFILLSKQPITHNKWHFITATFNAIAGRAGLYIDGQLVEQEVIPRHPLAWPASEIYIGKSAKDEKFRNTYPVNVLNGIIDEVTIWGKDLEPLEIETMYKKQLPASDPDMGIPVSRFTDDFQRPKYHAVPKSGWTNEPHGLIYFNGAYHFFNQKNANGPYLRNINWGHQVSKDLLHWKDTATVLWPEEEGYDELNIWSGHLVINKEVPTIFYTGVNRGYHQTICTAYSNDSLKSFTKYTGNPLISYSPTDYLFNEFRDPYVFRNGNNWYMIVGTGIRTMPQKGAVILYKSADLINWNYVGPMFVGNPASDESGIFWELPVFHQFGKKYLLMVNRVPLPGVPAETFYWVGNFENDKFIPDNNQPKKLELINWLLVPCINYDEDGRLIAIGFIADEIPIQKQYMHGWTHCFSLPRVWSLKGDSVLVQSPHPFLEKLRTDKTSYGEVMISPGKSNLLPNAKGFQLEIDATFTRKDASLGGFIIGQSSDNTEFTKIYYDYDSARVVVDRRKSSKDVTLQGTRVSQKFTLDDSKQITWRIFIDGSVVEVFINNEAAFVTRMWPVSPASNQVDLFAEGGAALASVNIWKLALNHEDQNVELKN